MKKKTSKKDIGASYSLLLSLNFSTEVQRSIIEDAILSMARKAEFEGDRVIRLEHNGCEKFFNSFIEDYQSGDLLIAFHGLPIIRKFNIKRKEIHAVTLCGKRLKVSEET